MSTCPKCFKEGREVSMVLDGGTLVCPECTYQYSLQEKMPTYDELLKLVKENEHLRQLVIDLEERLAHIEID